MVGFRSAGPSGTLSKAQDLMTTPYRGIDVPPYVAPATPSAPPIDYSNNNDNNTNNSNQASLNYIDNYNQSINTFGSEGMTQANIDNPVANPTDFYGNPIEKEVYGPAFDPSILVPGGGFMALNQPSIPTSGYGTPGTYSSLSGGRFDNDGRAINPVTGQPLQEYATVGAFANKMIDDPLGNILGDTSSSQGSLRDMEYARQKSEYAKLKEGGTDVMGNPVSTGLSNPDSQKVAQALGEDMGFESHTVAPGTATNEAIATNSVVPGSQYSPTGTFVNPSDDNNNNDNNDQGHDGTDGGYGGEDNTVDHGGFNTGGLVPELGMPKRDRDIPNPILQDPLGGLI